ncbi:two-component regulator propeller domain-containing protein [Chitinophagaceae bacterium LWZ2-11]
MKPICVICNEAVRSRKLRLGFIRIVLLCIISLFIISAQAQNIGFRFKHLGIADGLSQSSVYCMYQDSKGFIWIGTTDGLSRYDGYEFKHFKYDQVNANSVSSNELVSLGEDKEGNLLVGTAAGLDLYDRKKEHFNRILLAGKSDSKAVGFVRAIHKDKAGNVWIGSRNGFMQYDAGKQILNPVNLGNSVGSHTINAIEEDAQHIFWLAVGHTIIRYNPATKQTLPLPDVLLNNPYFNKSTIYSLKLDSAQNVWIGTEREGLIVLDNKANKCINYSSETKPVPITNDMVRAIGFKGGNAWIGTRNGLFIINGKGEVMKHLSVDKYDPSSLSGNSVLCFMNDNAGSLWVGTFAGGISIDQPGNNNFSYIREQLDEKPGLNCKVVSRILEDKDHNLWIATEGGGINFFDRKKNTFKYIHVNPSSQHFINQELIKTIQFDNKNNLWIGTLEGLFYYNRSSGTVKEYPIAENPAATSDKLIYGLASDSTGLWIATKGGLFYLANTGKMVRYRHQNNDPNSIISNDINALIKDSHGGIWIGTEAGVSYLKKGETRFVNYLGEAVKVFNGNAILCMFEDAAGNIWIGTRGGGIKLLDRKHDTFFTINTDYGLADNIVHGIIQDKQGHFWISFSQSIAKIVLKKKEPPFTPADLEVTNYSVNNGLGTNEFLTATCKTDEGEIMFGGVNGIVAFAPEKLVINNILPKVALTDLLIKNIPVAVNDQASPLKQSITYTDEITLTHDQAYFTLRFAALNYINARTNQYAYILEGLPGEKDWNYIGNQQSATYTNLDAGNYIFKVKAANNDGLWNDNYTTLHIKVLPPVWKTWYAYLLYFLIIGALLYLFYSYSIKTDRLKNDLQMQQLYREKDQELMQRKLSFFTNISHEIKTPLTLILAPLENMIGLMKGDDQMTNRLLLMQRNGERLMRLTNQLLDFRKFEAGSMELQVTEGDIVLFVQRIFSSFEAYARYREIEFELITEQEGLSDMWFDKDKLEKMLYNLLSNAVKFTLPGGRITVSLKKADNTSGRDVIIKVEDTGAGIAPEHLENIFSPFQHYNTTGLQIDGTGIGLAFTKGLVTLHHGTITVESRVAAAGQEGYTCFTITLPADKNCYTDDEIAKEPVDVQTLDNYPIPATDPEEWQSSSAEPGEKPIMLIVEDNKEVLAFTAAHFSETFTVHTAANGKEGCEIATTIIPDIIISDVTMPEMPGTELCKQLKNDARTSHIPIILLTARAPLTYQMEGYETGADDYITKPFSLALLQIRVNNLITSRRMLRERYRRDITLQPKNIAITSADEVFLERVMKFIDDNIMEPTLNVEELGKKVNMSRITLYRKIKALTNQSTIEFIRSVRLKKAAQLLQRNEYTVNEVAYMVGFSDVDYFRKWFKNEFGRTPKTYSTDKE